MSPLPQKEDLAGSMGDVFSREVVGNSVVFPPACCEGCYFPAKLLETCFLLLAARASKL